MSSMSKMYSDLSSILFTNTVERAVVIMRTGKEVKVACYDHKGEYPNDLKTAEEWKGDPELALKLEELVNKVLDGDEISLPVHMGDDIDDSGRSGPSTPPETSAPPQQ